MYLHFISRFWIIFTIIILDAFSGRLPISSSFIWFSGFLSCSFTCWIFLCHFNLFRLLCLGWPFSMLEVCGFSLLWRFLTLDGVGLVSCQGFLDRETCICVLVELSLFSLECNEVMSFEVSMGWLWLWAACILMLRAMFLCCRRISMLWNLLALGWNSVSV